MYFHKFSGHKLDSFSARANRREIMMDQSCTQFWLDLQLCRLNSKTLHNCESVTIVKETWNLSFFVLWKVRQTSRLARDLEICPTWGSQQADVQKWKSPCYPPPLFSCFLPPPPPPLSLSSALIICQWNSVEQLQCLETSHVACVS